MSYILKIVIQFATAQGFVNDVTKSPAYRYKGNLSRVDRVIKIDQYLKNATNESLEEVESALLQILEKGSTVLGHMNTKDKACVHRILNELCKSISKGRKNTFSGRVVKYRKMSFDHDRDMVHTLIDTDDAALRSRVLVMWPEAVSHMMRRKGASRRNLEDAKSDIAEWWGDFINETNMTNNVTEETLFKMLMIGMKYILPAKYNW